MSGDEGIGSDDGEPPRRTTEIIWPADRVQKFWRAVRAGRAVILELVRRDSPDRVQRDRY